MSSSRNRSTDDLLDDLGRQVREARIDADLDQPSLAGLAGVSTATLSKLENGHGSTLTTFVRVVRALDRTDWLDDLAPTVSVSPIRMADSGGRARQRVRVGRTGTATPARR